VYRQQQLLDHLQARVLQLAQQFRSAQADVRGRPEDEIPPHW
ncbi:MAG: SlyX family protein, partial [Azoarcus sp.]|nr:SlyX family protein [Azoarcus sp.]